MIPILTQTDNSRPQNLTEWVDACGESDCEVQHTQHMRLDYEV